MEFEAAYPCFILVTKGFSLSRMCSLFAHNVNMANQGEEEVFSQQVPGVDNAIEIMYSETGKKSANIRNLHGLAWRRLDAF
jgi:hypothetical protein